MIFINLFHLEYNKYQNHSNDENSIQIDCKKSEQDKDRVAINDEFLRIREDLHSINAKNGVSIRGYLEGKV